MDQIPTGIAKLDALLNGGLPKGRTCLISGEPGTGKTTFALQFLLEGAKNNEKTVYIAIDEKPEQIIENAHTLGWDLTPYLENGTLEFLDITAYFGAQIRITETLNFDRIVRNIMSFVSERKTNRLVIDPISPLILSSKQTPELAYYIRRTILKAEEIQDCTTLLTSPIPYGTSKLSANGIEEIMTSGVILLESHPSNQRTLSIKKMRGLQINTTEYQIKIQKHSGIEL